jgi:hypothetical protein
MSSAGTNPGTEEDNMAKEDRGFASMIAPSGADRK